MASKVATRSFKLASWPVFIYALLFAYPSVTSEQCGIQNAHTLCPGDLCCSQYGYCGTAKDYCGDKCQSNCGNPSSPSFHPSFLEGPPPVHPTAGASMKRVAYFGNWAYTNPSPFHFFPENLTGHHSTHAIYAFAAIDTKTFQVIPTDPADLGPDPGRHPDKGFYFRFNRCAHALGIKTLISIGGGGGAVTAASFSAMASSPLSLTTFVESAVAFVHKYGFDGMDVDWEFPSNSVDRTRFVTLIRALRSRISTSQIPLLLTAAVAAYKPDIEASYSVPDLNRYLDWVSVMAYDLHGSWEPTTGLHTALSDSSAPVLSIEGAVDTWRSLGMSGGKIVVGFAAYGHEWELANPANHGVGAKTLKGGNRGGPITQGGDGTWAYFEIADFFLKEGAIQVFDEGASSMYAYKGNKWIGYDNPRSIRIKAKWAQQNGLGGYMFWSMDLDSKYALARAAKKATI